MRLAILNDSHVGARDASDVFMNYIGRFYSEVFFPYCDANGIDRILHLGDYYDNRKYINFRALNNNRKTFLEPMRERGMRMDILLGNHDVFYKNTNDLNSLKELLGYFKKDVRIVLKPEVLDYGGCAIALVPWINPENRDGALAFLSTCKASIVAGHFELAGFETTRGGPPTHCGTIDSSVLDRFELVLSGHYHTKSNRDTIHYLGTQYELTWSDVDDPKYFHVFDTDTRTLVPVRNPLSIHRKLVYDDSIHSDTVSKLNTQELTGSLVKVVVSKKTRLDEFERFMKAVESANPHEVQLIESLGEFAGASVDVDDSKVVVSDTAALLSTYVDSLPDISLDKHRLKSELSRLYTEAQTMEAP